MRPIVKAVGLICLLKHDHLIVKIKVLFRNPVSKTYLFVFYCLIECNLRIIRLPHFGDRWHISSLLLYNFRTLKLR